VPWMSYRRKKALYTTKPRMFLKIEDF